MEKPLLEMKRFGRKIHLMVEKLAKAAGAGLAYCCPSRGRRQGYAYQGY